MEGRVIFALLILLDHRDHGVGSDEAGDVIDVAVSVVAGDTAIEPDDRLRTKIVGKELFISRAVHGRVALLSGREKALLSGDESPAAVDIDRSTLQHDTTVARDRTCHARTGHLG